MKCLRCEKYIGKSYHNVRKYCHKCVLYRSRRYGRLTMQARRKNPRERKILNQAVKRAAAKLRLGVLTHYSRGKL